MFEGATLIAGKRNIPLVLVFGMVSAQEGQFSIGEVLSENFTHWFGNHNNLSSDSLRNINPAYLVIISGAASPTETSGLRCTL